MHISGRKDAKRTGENRDITFYSAKTQRRFCVPDIASEHSARSHVWNRIEIMEKRGPLIIGCPVLSNLQILGKEAGETWVRRFERLVRRWVVRRQRRMSSGDNGASQPEESAVSSASAHPTAFVSAGDQAKPEHAHKTMTRLTITHLHIFNPPILL